MDLAQAGGADGLAVGDESAVGVDRKPAADPVAPSASSRSWSPSAQNPFSAMWIDLGPGVGVLQLDHVDVPRADPGLLVRGARHVNGRRRSALGRGKDGVCTSKAPKRRVRTSDASK